jgi:hypothetical protein
MISFSLKWDAEYRKVQVEPRRLSHTLDMQWRAAMRAFRMLLIENASGKQPGKSTRLGPGKLL